MKKQILNVAAGLALILFVCIVNAIGQTNSPTSTPSPSPSPTPIEVMYTGRLLGYFRVPSLQELKPFKGCPERSDADSADSAAAQAFLKQRKTDSAILVGMGDNFAPHLEARMFAPPAETPTPASEKYVPLNKEQYYGDGENGWEFYDPDDPGHKKSLEKIIERIAAGYGTIPTDNVACFLRAARFAAIVPGKHDFYFGADRVRQLARFLATTKSKENNYEPVQMLGANLVLKTTRIDGFTPAKIEQPRVGGWPKEYKVLNIKEGRSVYPWLSSVQIQVIKLRSDEKPIVELKKRYPNGNLPDNLEEIADNIRYSLPATDSKEYTSDKKTEDEAELDQLKNNFSDLRTTRLCKSRGGPDQIPDDFNHEECKPPKENGRETRLVDNTIVLSFKLRPEETGKHGHFSTVLPGKNYGLCVVRKKGCLRFSVYTPLFYFPHSVPQESTDNYTDPDPFVVIDNRVAIFGVVDPDLGEQVGILNFGWVNKQNELTTRVSVEDPAEALQQQLDYFKELNPDFPGLKILLAQTSPQRARALVSKFPEFQIVLSGADKEQATSEVEISSTWDPTRHKRPFIAVPAPYFDAASGKGSVHFGKIRATQDSSKWKLENATSLESVDPVEIGPPSTNSATEFWTRIKALPGCLPDRYKNLSTNNATNEMFLQWFVLCAMRDHLNADVALIQKRDLFTQIPDVEKAKDKSLPRAQTGQSPQEINRYMQQTLDSLIWKGDLVTLLYVPGSALKKALQQSDHYLSEQTSSLSLVIDRDRQLEKLGISGEDGEYFINDLPLDENKIYSVATTDYIGAGDTGYPDLVKSALNPRTHPAAFPGKLVPISGLVCRKLFTNTAERSKYCLERITGDYFDETTAQQIPPYKQPSFSKRVKDFFKSGWPAGSTEPENKGDAIEQTVHRREIWRLSLEKFTFGFKGLGKNLSDKEVGEKFEGIPVPGVTATESETYDVALNTRLSRSSHKREFFVQTGLEFERQSIGDTPSAFQISQASNRLFGETGLVVWRTPGRSLPNFGLNFSLYAETQVTRPFSDFDLATDGKIRITQNRSLLLLPRFGLRWQGLANSAEVGIQAGREINALSGYQFTAPGGIVECLAKDAPSFSKCIKDHSDPETGGLITKDTPHRVLFDDRPRAGMYWKVVLSQPFTSKIRYELEDTGDFFFVNFSKDTTVDTRFRIISKHRLSFVIWPSVSIGPALDLLLYQNKVNRDFLFQRQFGFETKVSFDIFNRREKGVQFKHKP